MLVTLCGHGLLHILRIYSAGFRKKIQIYEDSVGADSILFCGGLSSKEINPFFAFYCQILLTKNPIYVRTYNRDLKF